jgi:glycosyltransferase involved in cell wall biosynthesis
MRTVHVDDGRSWRGGQAQVLLLARGLVARGVEATLVVPPGAPLYDRATAIGLSVEPLLLRGEWDVVSVLGLARILRRQRADVVHAHTAHAVTLAGLAGRIARAPLVLAARRVDFALSRLGRLKLRHLADRVIAVSDGVARVLAQGGVPDSRIEVVRSAIDLDAARAGADPARFRAELGIGDVPLVGTVGALVDHKDHETLVAAAALVHARRPDAVFVIAGEGERRAALVALIEARGLAGTVRLLGFRHDVPSILAALDVFVLSSHLEGLGTTVLDAMSAGAPVVATRTGGVPEMIDDQRTGLLVPPRDPAGLAAAIGRLLDDRALAARLRDAARNAVGERFGADRMVDETLAIYRRCLDRR